MPREKVLCGKEEIFRVAYSIVEKNGIEALSIRNITKELGIATMTIYNYVESLKEIKKRILISGFDQMYSVVYNALNRLPHPMDTYDYCLEICMSIYRFAMENKKIYTFMFSEGLQLFRDDGEIRPFYNQITKLTKRSKVTGNSWQENERAFQLLEMIAISVPYQVCAGAQQLTEEEYADLIGYYLKRAL